MHPALQLYLLIHLLFAFLAFRAYGKDAFIDWRLAIIVAVAALMGGPPAFWLWHSLNKQFGKIYSLHSYKQ